MGRVNAKRGTTTNAKRTAAFMASAFRSIDRPWRSCLEWTLFRPPFSIVGGPLCKLNPNRRQELRALLDDAGEEPHRKSRTQIPSNLGSGSIPAKTRVCHRGP